VSGHDDIRDAVARLCATFPGEYWRAKDRERAYPSEFVDKLTELGLMTVQSITQAPDAVNMSDPAAAGLQRLEPGRTLVLTALLRVRGV
jgi:alkylation response protein AidB-like acyl-CoA dehydrogenase